MIDLVALSAPLVPPRSGNWQVGLSDPARTVMTDFNEHGMISVVPSMQIDEALEVMRHAGVRSAFVLGEHDAAHPHPSVLGLVTAYDVMGEKPIRYLQVSGGAREEVTVTDIMDPSTGWQAVRLADLKEATVAHVLGVLQKIAKTHLPVVEPTEGHGAHEWRLRGVFSAAKLLRLTQQARSATRS